MKDLAHHRKFLQKKVLQEAKKESKKSKKVVPISEGQKTREEEKLAEDRRNPEFEGDKFDPHHRKPRLLKRINYH